MIERNAPGGNAWGVFLHSSEVHLMPKSRRQGFKFDVALSFAGQDRAHAEAVARAMQAIGLRVFYDKDFGAHLWGKDRTEYERIYGPESQYVVPIISHHYPTRKWTMWEIGTALREAPKRDEEFILPLRLDDTRIFGLSDDHNYLPIPDFTAAEIAQHLATKLTAHNKRRPETSSQPISRANALHLLTTNARAALALIAFAPMPVSLTHLIALFPDFPWKRHVSRFSSLQLVKDSGTMLAVPKIVGRSFQPEESTYRTTWRNRLEELAEYPDCAYLLSFQYLIEQRYDDMVWILGADAEGLQHSTWRPLYASALQQFEKFGLMRKVRPDTRDLLHHALAQFHSMDGEQDKALCQLFVLRKRCQRSKNYELLGATLLQIGVVFNQLDNRRDSEKWLTAALRHGESHNDSHLLALANANLGQLISDSDPSRALLLLNRALHLNRGPTDWKLVAELYEVMAVTYASLGDSKNALKHYDKAEKLARRLHLDYFRTFLLNNKANTLYQYGKTSQSLKTLRHCLTAATREGYRDVCTLAAEGLARIHFEQGNYVEAVKYFSELKDYARDANSVEYTIIALHGLGLTHAIQGQHDLSGRAFAAALRAARKHGQVSWIIRCQIDSSRTIDANGIGSPDVKALHTKALTNEREGRRTESAALWQSISNIYGSSGQSQQALLAIQKALTLLLPNSNEIDRTLEAYESLYSLQWESRLIPEAVATLETIAAFAKTHRRHDIHVATLVQLGNSYHETDRYTDALNQYRRAVEVATRFEVESERSHALYQLGHCQLECGDTTAAMESFTIMLGLARDHGESDSFAAAMYGQSLVYQANGSYALAAKCLRKIQVNSKRHSNWMDYANSWDDLGTLSWSRGRLKTAIKQYKRALEECRRHSLEELGLTVAINLAKAYSADLNAEEALRLLHKFEKVADRYPVAAELHGQLGRLYEESGRMDKALNHFARASEVGRAADDLVAVEECSEEITRVQSAQRIAMASSYNLEMQLDKELTVDRRTEVLCELVQVYLFANDEERAIAAFNKCKSHLESHNKRDQLLDLHLAIFDHDWKGNFKSRLEAMHAYTAAVIVAFDSNEGEAKCDERYSRLYMHVFQKLIQRSTAPSPTQLARLIERYRIYMKTTFRARKHIVDMLLTPFCTAQRFVPYINNPYQMLKEEKRLQVELSQQYG